MQNRGRGKIERNTRFTSSSLTLFTVLCIGRQRHIKLASICGWINPVETMKRNNPDYDDSASRDIESGDLNEWDYLTTFYDRGEMLDDHNILSVSGNEAYLPPQNDQLNSEPSTGFTCTLLRPPRQHDRTDLGQQHIRRLGIRDEGSRVQSQRMRHSQSSVLSRTESSNDQSKRESDTPEVAASTDHEQNPVGYSDMDHHSRQTDYSKSTLWQSFPDVAHQKDLSTYDQRLVHLSLPCSDNILPLEHQEIVEQSTSSGHTNDRNIPTLETNTELERWSLNLSRHGTEANIALEQWREKNYGTIEPTPIVHTEQDQTQHASWAYSEFLAAKTIPNEKVSTQVLHQSHPFSPNDQHALQIERRPNDYNTYHRNDVVAFREIESGVLAVANNRELTGSPSIQNHVVVPPYQQQQNNSLLLKPLTPYNYFYRDERDNIVLQISNENDLLPPPVSDFSAGKMCRLLHQHWYVDPVRAKRIHRKTHGKMSFQNLSKIISERWRTLSIQGREFYRLVSRNDEMYYNQHLSNIMNNDGSIDPSPTSAEGEDDTADVDSKSQSQSNDQVEGT